MNRFEARQQPRGEFTCYSLHDLTTGARATIVPELGNNCLSLRLPNPNGGLTQVIDDLAFIDQVRALASRYGTPILYPWPGRIPLGEYSFRGRRYRAPILDSDNNAAHGLVRQREWFVEAYIAGHDSASLTCSISTHDHPDILRSFPFPNRLIITHELGAAGLTIKAEVINEGDSAMPFGIGFHPYFRLPPGSNSRREDCLLQIDAQKQWNFAALKQISTIPETAVADSLTDNFMPPEPVLLSPDNCDQGFTRLRESNGVIEGRLIDPAAGIAVRVLATRDFQSLITFCPRNRDAMCIEPWTCPPNGFNLAAAGGVDHGVLALEPGEKWHGEIRISLEEFLDNNGVS